MPLFTADEGHVVSLYRPVIDARVVRITVEGRHSRQDGLIAEAQQLWGESAE